MCDAHCKESLKKSVKKSNTGTGGSVVVRVPNSAVGAYRSFDNCGTSSWTSVPEALKVDPGQLMPPLLHWMATLSTRVDSDHAPRAVDPQGHAVADHAGTHVSSDNRGQSELAGDDGAVAQDTPNRQ